MKYSFAELNANSAITHTTEGVLSSEVRSFFMNRDIDEDVALVFVGWFNEHFLNFQGLDYHFILDTATVAEARTRFGQFIHYILDEQSPLLMMYARNINIDFGGKDTNTWTDNDRTTQGRSNYGSTSRTAREDSPLGSDPVGAIDTPAEKSGSEVTGGASRTEVRSGSSTEVREKSDDSERLKQYWSGFKNFDGVIHNCILYTTDEHYCVI